MSALERAVARGGVDLTGGRQHMRRSAEILVPRGLEDRFDGVICTCNVCGAKFGRGERAEWQRHVGDCGRKHLDEIRERGAHERGVGTIFDDELWDPEYAKHLRDQAPKLIREGRFELKPHER